VAVTVNLLRSTVQLRLLHDPSLLEGMVEAELRPGTSGRDVLVVIDEVQKVPLLLDEVHRLIEERGWRFILTGSSARKLRVQGVNLLAGRAWIAKLFPLTFAEMPKFDLDRYLRYGGLPGVVNSPDPIEQLDAYVTTYMNEEIKAEGAVRKLPAFVEFLRIAALGNGQLINFANIARDVGVSAPTVAGYYQILEDTLVGFQLNPWKKPTNRKPISTAKFYFFDTGVVNTLSGTKAVDRNSNLYGSLFEQWIAMELVAYLSYRRIKDKLYFWRTEDKVEVDFIVENCVAIEVKSTAKVTGSDLRGLTALMGENLVSHYYIVSNDTIDRIKDQVHHLHWRSFLRKLWHDELPGLGP
jgi:predicted AAA+ superfamily ATPase